MRNQNQKKRQRGKSGQTRQAWNDDCMPVKHYRWDMTRGEAEELLGMTPRSLGVVGESKEESLRFPEHICSICNLQEAGVL